MCGIVGFFNTRNPIKQPHALIANMTDRLIHRGPDDHGIWMDKTIALGHRRLRILDRSSSGHQPMSSHTGRYVIAYNGEIYNSPQLKKQLEHKQHTFHGYSDTEVILTLIEEYGFDDALKQLTGMFSFALWDIAENILRLVRDRIGEKPLYYGLIEHNLVFASELKAIRIFPHFRGKISAASVSSMMHYGYIPAPQSIYEQIYKLLPGSCLTITDSSNLPEPQRYWSTLNTVEQGIQSPLCITEQDAIQQLDLKLQQIIQHQMIADVPTGAFLSGGIDSSVITAIMQAQSHQPIKTFTIGFKESKFNEAGYAKAIAKHLKTNHTELYVDTDHVLTLLPKLANIYDEPFADSSAIPTYLLSKLAHEQVTIVLSGDGGDELFGGYNRYRWGQSIWRILALVPYSLRLFLQKNRLSTISNHHRIQKIVAILTAKSPADLYQQFIAQWPHPHEILMAPSCHDNILYEVETMSFIEKMMVTDLMTYLPDDLMVKVDRAAMAVSLENRAPFLDHHLIAWMWSLPIDMKIRHRKTKWLLRQVLSRYVPPVLFERPKMGFGIPLDTWLRGPLHHWANRLLDKDHLEQHGFLKSGPILRKWEEHLSGRANHAHQLWTILMLQAWMERIG